MLSMFSPNSQSRVGLIVRIIGIDRAEVMIRSPSWRSCMELWRAIYPPAVNETGNADRWPDLGARQTYDIPQ